MSLIVEGLTSDVATLAELGDESVAAVAERISAVLARSTPARILELLSDVAAELSAELPDGHVEIRVVGDDVELAYVDAQPGPAESDGGDLSARITLRLSEALKSRVEEAATQVGSSVNSWIVRTLERGAAPSSGRTTARGMQRLHGFGTS